MFLWSENSNPLSSVNVWNLPLFSGCNALKILSLTLEDSLLGVKRNNVYKLLRSTKLNRSLVRFSNNQITFKVSNSSLLIHYIRSFTDTSTVRNLSPSLLGMGSVTPIFPLSPEVLIKKTALFLISVYILVDGFMRGHGFLIGFFKISLNLFG